LRKKLHFDILKLAYINFTGNISQNNTLSLKVQRHFTPGRLYQGPVFINPVVFEVLRAVVMKSSVFWVITPCNPLEVKERVISMYSVEE
jgi:hypothetical protein